MKLAPIIASIAALACVVLILHVRAERENLWAGAYAAQASRPGPASGQRVQKEQAVGPFLSETNSGLYFSVDGSSHYTRPKVDARIQSNDLLVWGLFCTTGHVRAWYPAREAYWLRLAMKGPDAKWVPKTARGARYGGKFDDIAKYEVIRRGLGPHLGAVLFHEEAGPPLPEPDIPPLVGSSTLLPRPEELFSMAQPGIYTMYIQMQLWRSVSEPPASTWPLVRFRPMAVKIERKAPD
jgi:hypothetical protein